MDDAEAQRDKSIWNAGKHIRLMGNGTDPELKQAKP